MTLSLPDIGWFYWTLTVVIGLPVGLVVLTELHNGLARRGSGLARPVALIRSYLLPLGALLILLTKANEVSAQATPVRIVATAFGFAVLVLLLSGLGVTLFEIAPQGSWRRRMPSIFLDVARFVLIAAGLAVILSYVWGADVGGLFTALGITSIVLGLTLQNSVGQIISGLFVLFEQPFQLGDWVETPAARGQVVEVNWRATHIRTGTGLQIMPNSVLAAASFANLSRPPGAYAVSVDTVFAVNDSPDAVCDVLTRVAHALPQRRVEAPPVSVATGEANYRTSIPLRSPADATAAQNTFLRWLWYAARRAGLHLNEADDDFPAAHGVEQAVQTVAPTLRLNPDEQLELPRHIRLARYGAGELLHGPGDVPEQMSCLVAGRVQLTVTTDAGAVVPVRTLVAGDWLGQTALTREPVSTTACALTETTVAEIGHRHLEQLVYRKPLLLQDISRTIDDLREGAQRAVATAPAP